MIYMWVETSFELTLSISFIYTHGKVVESAGVEACNGARRGGHEFHVVIGTGARLPRRLSPVMDVIADNAGIINRIPLQACHCSCGGQWS